VVVAVNVQFGGVISIELQSCELEALRLGVRTTGRYRSDETALSDFFGRRHPVKSSSLGCSPRPHRSKRLRLACSYPASHFSRAALRPRQRIERRVDEIWRDLSLRHRNQSILQLAARPRPVRDDHFADESTKAPPGRIPLPVFGPGFIHKLIGDTQCDGLCLHTGCSASSSSVLVLTSCGLTQSSHTSSNIYLCGEVRAEALAWRSPRLRVPRRRTVHWDEYSTIRVNCFVVRTAP